MSKKKYDDATLAIIETLLEEGVVKTEEEAIAYVEEQWVKLKEGVTVKVVFFTEEDVKIMRRWFKETLGARPFTTEEAIVYNRVMGE